MHITTGDIDPPRGQENIKDISFHRCTQMTTAVLGEGLKEMGAGALFLPSNRLRTRHLLGAGS